MKNELRITFDINDNCEVEIHGAKSKHETEERKKKIKNKNPLKRNLNRESEPILIVKKVNDDKAISNIKNIDSELELMSLTTSAVATSIVVAKKEGYTGYAKKLAKVINHMVDDSLFDFVKEV